jgi:tripartite ATP-independent transporter DctP family solute receptor
MIGGGKMKARENRRFKIGVVAVTLIMLFGGFIGGIINAQAEAPKVAIKLGHGMQTTHPRHKASLRVAEYVSEKTGGKFQISVYPARQLGDERDNIMNVMTGSLDMCQPVLGAFGTIYPPVYIASLAYAFRDLDHANKVYNGKIGKEVVEQFIRQKKVRLLQPFWYYGVRHLTTTSVPVRKPEDLKGLKIRTPPVAVHRESVQAMGCTAVPVAWGELYLALKQGVVDGQENPLPAIRFAALHEVQKYLMLTGHIIAHSVVAINEDKYQSLPPEYQKILYEAVREAAKLNDEITLQQESDFVDWLQKEGGMTMIKVDRSEFQKKVKASEVHKKYEKHWGDLYDRIQL